MSKPPRPLATRLRYGAETALVYAVYGLFRLFPLDAASDLGGWLGRTIGPLMGISRVARRNLEQALPEKTAAEREQIVRGVWDNLGRVIAEYPHLHRISSRIELVGKEHIDHVRESGKASIFFAGHLANWELCAVAARMHGIDLHLVYRKPNNPGVDSLLRHARNSGAASHIEKGTEGARDMVAVLRGHGALGMLMDQKLNEGLPIPFLGRDAMTAPAIAHFAMKFNCPVYPARAERLGGARFRVTVYPPLAMPTSGDKDQDVRAMLTEINGMFESWIRARPEQWLWIHRRWPS